MDLQDPNEDGVDGGSGHHGGGYDPAAGDLLASADGSSAMGTDRGSISNGGGSGSFYNVVDTGGGSDGRSSPGIKREEDDPQHQHQQRPPFCHASGEAGAAVAAADPAPGAAVITENGAA
eukprot:CAMPEP_0178576456 /NCGR_PEP_ID=MMETSP0697-20121206/20467_1 /TAXON_ID=265572 /ORGANISM="Extubocellulus spinifer, Strain CCMP396" /LENGTH=119 /DNA_ID=CAMNT_0020211655 /DNA_START=236 /DNA_END=592 /DNA_ORIENTATION=+